MFALTTVQKLDLDHIRKTGVCLMREETHSCKLCHKLFIMKKRQKCV